MYSLPQLLTRGYELFVNIPPHADPVAVRLTTTMLADGVSCPAGSSPRIPEKIVLGGRKPVKTAQVIEAAILIAVERLFDASDCVSFDRNGNQADMTCRLLEKYDQYMQAGRPKATETGFSGRLQDIKILDLSSSPASGEETNISSSTGPSPPGMEALGRSSSSLNENEGMSALQEIQIVSQELREEQAEQLAERPLEESTGRTGRILMYTQNAAASAVAISRLSMYTMVRKLVAQQPSRGIWLLGACWRNKFASDLPMPLGDVCFSRSLFYCPFRLEVEHCYHAHSDVMLAKLIFHAAGSETFVSLHG